MNNTSLIVTIVEAIVGFLAILVDRKRRASSNGVSKRDPCLSLVLAREMTNSANITRLSQLAKKHVEKIRRLEAEMTRLKAEVLHLQNELARSKNERF